MKYKEFEEKCKSFDKSKEEYIVQMCLDAAIQAVNELNIHYKVMLNQFISLFENQLTIGYYNGKFEISHYQFFHIRIPLEHYGDFCNKNLVKEKLEYAIKIYNFLKEDEK